MTARGGAAENAAQPMPAESHPPEPMRALIVDAVVAAIATHQATGVVDLSTVLGYVAVEGVLVAAVAASQRGLRVASPFAIRKSAVVETV